MTRSRDDIIDHLKRVLTRRGFAASDANAFIQEAVMRLEMVQSDLLDAVSAKVRSVVFGEIPMANVS